MAGISTTNLPLGTVVVELIANCDLGGGILATSRVRASDLIALLLGGTSWLWQIKLQLSSDGRLAAVEAAVPADTTDIINILWTSGTLRTKQGDRLSNFIKTTLGYSDAQMTALHTAAAAQSI